MKKDSHVVPKCIPIRANALQPQTEDIANDMEKTLASEL